MWKKLAANSFEKKSVKFKHQTFFRFVLILIYREIVTYHKKSRNLSIDVGRLQVQKDFCC